MNTVTRTIRATGIILAAGQGLRMGKTKQLLPIDGRPMLQHIIDNALSSQLDEVIVVLGHDTATIRNAVDLSQVRVVENPDYAEGQSSSVRAGVKALSPDIDAALFLLADQPLVDADIINCLIKAYPANEGAILRPVFEGKPGNPVMMDKQVFSVLTQLKGDTGGRAVFDQFRDQIRKIPAPHGGIHLDLDTWEAYSLFTENRASRPEGKTLYETLQPEVGSVISFVGAGGKTTAIFTLAREMKEKGFKVLVTTTTAMYHPDRDGWKHDQLWLKSDMQPLAPPKNGNGSITVAAARYNRQSEKIGGYAPEVIDDCRQRGRFDTILVEADGSKEKPLKAPTDHEPVIPVSTQYLIGLVGLSAVGRPLTEEWVHRYARFSKLTGLDEGKAVTTTAIAALVGSKMGLFKSCPKSAERILVLNQADDDALFEAGRRIGKSVTTIPEECQAPSRVLVCRLSSRQPVRAIFQPYSW